VSQSYKQIKKIKGKVEGRKTEALQESSPEICHKA